MNDLIAELRNLAAKSNDGYLRGPALQAAARLEALEAENAQKDAENARLRKVLEPFADVSDLIDAETEGISEADEFELRFHDFFMAAWPASLFRSARRALSGGQDGQ